MGLKIILAHESKITSENHETPKIPFTLHHALSFQLPWRIFLGFFLSIRSNEEVFFFYLLPLLMAILLHSLSLHPPNPKPQNPNRPKILSPCATFRRDVVLRTASLCFVSFVFQNPIPDSLADPLKSPKPLRLSIANTKSWSQFYGDGFAIRVPPQFEDVNEPEVCICVINLLRMRTNQCNFVSHFVKVVDFRGSWLNQTSQGHSVHLAAKLGLNQWLFQPI